MSKASAKSLLFILLIIGLLWARSSWGKITGGTFVSSLGGTLGKIVDKNPYPWFKDFLNNTVIPNSSIFGMLTFWGEFISAIFITLGAFVLLISPRGNRPATMILILGLIGGAFLNIIFWLGFGYTSPSTDGLNLLMAAVEIIGVFAVSREL